MPKRNAGDRLKAAKTALNQVSRRARGVVNRRAATRGLAPTASAAGKSVTFACSRPGLLVAISVANVRFVFERTGGAELPTGSQVLYYAVKGGAGSRFTITADGAVMPPIEDEIPSGATSTGGSSPITV